jgi:hypothetical protein
VRLELDAHADELARMHDHAIGRELDQRAVALLGLDDGVFLDCQGEPVLSGCCFDRLLH